MQTTYYKLNISKYIFKRSNECGNIVNKTEIIDILQKYLWNNGELMTFIKCQCVNTTSVYYLVPSGAQCLMSCWHKCFNQLLNYFLLSETCSNIKNSNPECKKKKPRLIWFKFLIEIQFLIPRILGRIKPLKGIPMDIFCYFCNSRLTCTKLEQAC